MYHDDGMKEAEVEVNKRVTIMANDKEYAAFQHACLDARRSVSEVLREAMRDFVASAKGKRRK